MRYIQQSRERWVGFSGLEYELCGKVLHADACLSDLDDTDALSPAKRIALHDWPQRFLSDKAYRRWFLRTGWHYLLDGKKSESGMWKAYVDTILKEQQSGAPEQEKELVWRKSSLEEIKVQLDAQFIVRSIFPGVTDLYFLLPADKFYVSRNIPLVTETYAKCLGIQESHSEVYNKWQFVEDFVQRHPQYQRYIVRGDSEEDKEMEDVLRSRARARKIEYIVGIAVAQRKGENLGFEIETSRDQNGLVECLNIYKR